MSAWIRKLFGERVRELREASGVSQEVFADHSGFARSYVSRVERGMANPSLDAVEVLALALAVEVPDLFVASSRTAESVTLVPFANDGSCFHPGLLRQKAKTYGVGEKSGTHYFESFDDALAHLRSMQVAKWWRPNSKGAWGLVSAIRWAPLPQVLDNSEV
jgi:transcriptional regulator with XRE-family HTH domain